jgi:hypothetical protein
VPDHSLDATPPEAVAAPPQAAPALPMPLSAQLARSASAMGNQAFGTWARGPGAAGELLPSRSAHQAWAPSIAREPGTAAPPAGGDAAADPIEVKGLQFGKSLLDGVIPAAGGDMSKTFSTHLGQQAQFGPYGLQVPLFPGVFASFGAGGAMSAKADASLTLTGTNVADAVMGQASKQEATASGSGTATGKIAGSLAAGVHIGVPGLANVGVAGQGTMAFEAAGDASFSGSIKRFKPKGEQAWLPWSGEIVFDAHLKGSLIAAAHGYFEYQLLWLYEDKFGDFKIGEWTLAEAGLDVRGSLKPGQGLQVDLKPWVGALLQPGVTQQIRQRTESEREKAERLAHQGEAGVPPIARSMRLARADDPPTPPPAAGPPPAAPPDPGSSDAAAMVQGGGDVTLPAEPKIEDT